MIHMFVVNAVVVATTTLVIRLLVTYFLRLFVFFTLVVIIIKLTHVVSANYSLLHVKLLEASAESNLLSKHVR